MNGRLPVTSAYSESSTERIPGRSWTVRLTGHSDRSATVTCSTAGCRMPPRSRDLNQLRTFAARHAAAHARAATVRPNASCHCRAQQCAAHEGTRGHCGGGVVMILRHDATVGRVWTVEEVCETCAPLIAHATALARAARPRPRSTAEPSPQASVPAPSTVPGGFSAPSAPSGPVGAAPASRRPGSGGRRPRRPGARGN
jgi:hypothetical protein